MAVNIDIVLGVVFVALITEAIVNALKRLIKADAPRAVIILSMVVSAFLCVVARLDLMSGFGYPLQMPYGVEVGAFFSGLVASLGASAVYDLFKQFNDYKEKLAVEKIKTDNNDPPFN